MSLLYLFFVIGTAFVRADILTLIPFSMEKYPSARCTDGSPGGYYFKQGQGEGTNTWIIYQAGGDWCWDEESCAKRCAILNVLCTSSVWPPTYNLSGIFDPLNDTRLVTAHKVFIQYCSSDAHMGDAGPSQKTFGWHFRGQAIISAVLTELPIQKGDTLIYGGGSAGARGAMVHLDYIDSMLPSALRGAVSLYGFLDSNLWIDAPTMPGVAFPGFQNVTQGVYSMANITHLDETCQLQNIDTPWKCIFPEYRMPYVRTPYFMVASQADEFQLSTNIGHDPPYNTAELSYALTFAKATVDRVLTTKAECSSCSIMSWSCYNHATSLSTSGFDHTQCNGTTTMGKALQKFLAGERALYRDICEGFACGAGCRT